MILLWFTLCMYRINAFVRLNQLDEFSVFFYLISLLRFLFGPNIVSVSSFITFVVAMWSNSILLHRMNTVKLNNLTSDSKQHTILYLIFTFSISTKNHMRINETHYHFPLLLPYNQVCWYLQWERKKTIELREKWINDRLRFIYFEK